MDRFMDEWNQWMIYMDRWMDRLMDEWIDRWMDIRIDGYMDE